MDISRIEDFDPLLKAEDCWQEIGCKHSKFYKMLKTGEFPPGIQTGPNSVRWRRSTVRGWIASRPLRIRDHQSEAVA